METTFGRPGYQFPPTREVVQGIIRFCREALDNEETPVLLGYSLGKSQELLRSLGEAGFPIMLHGAVYKLTKIYEQFGQSFPPYEAYEAGSAKGKVLICPPHVANSTMLRKLGKIRTAILTGWAVDPNCRYRYQCDAAFPISDHADFPDLIEMVKRVQPKKVYTLHGFAADFAQTLRELGYEAQALSEQEQFTLDLALDLKRKLARRRPARAGLAAQNGPGAGAGRGEPLLPGFREGLFRNCRGQSQARKGPRACRIFWFVAGERAAYRCHLAHRPAFREQPEQNPASGVGGFAQCAL